MYLYFQLPKVLLTLMADLFLFKHFITRTFDSLNLRLKNVSRTGKIALNILFKFFIEEIITLFLKFQAFFHTHVGPGILDIGNSSIIDAREIRVENRQIHGSIKMLSFECFDLCIRKDSFSQTQSLLHKLRPQIVKTAVIEMLKFLLID